MPALPVSEKHLCSFVSLLADQGLKYRTAKVYLSAIRHLQISAAQPDPFAGAPMARLEYVLRGIKKREVEKGAGPRERLPITPPLLLRMKEVWEPTGPVGLQDVVGSLLPVFLRVPAGRGDDDAIR